jgi:hypothetical protein
MPWETLRSISSKDDYDDGIEILDKIVKDMHKIEDKYAYDKGNIFAIGEVYNILYEADRMMKELDNPDYMTPEIQEKLYYASAFILMIAQKYFQPHY